MSKINILIVEDEAAIRGMLTIVLEQAGFSAIATAEIEGAQKILSEGLPDLILLDWMLPGITGVEWARRLKKDPSYRELPIAQRAGRKDSSGIA